MSYPWGQTLPPAGRCLELLPGLKWVRLPLPFALDHINVWLLRDRLDGREGWTLVDTGIGNEQTKAQWETVIAHDLEGLPIIRVLVTHMHPDHIGLASWHTDRWTSKDFDCRLWMSGTDFAVARMLTQRSDQEHRAGSDAAARHFEANGLTDPAALAKIRGRTGYFAAMVPSVPSAFRRLAHGDTVVVGERRWRCLAGYGHAPEHLSFYCEDLSDAQGGGSTPVLISGDMVLPRISTNVSVMDSEPEGDPLAQFLQSMAVFDDLPPSTLVLPSHGRPFRGLHTRVAQLRGHHDERFEEVRAACQAGPCCAADLLPVLFRRALDPHQMTFAMGEAMAHLHTLWMRGELRRQRDGQGIWRFSLVV